MAKHREYYKGKVVASPKSKPWWVLWICVCLWFVNAPKMVQLCKFVWVIDLLVILPNPYFRTPTCPSTPKMLWAKECTPIPHSFVVFTLDPHLSPLKNLGMCHQWYMMWYKMVFVGRFRFMFSSFKLWSVTHFQIVGFQLRDGGVIDFLLSCCNKILNAIQRHKFQGILHYFFHHHQVHNRLLILKSSIIIILIHEMDKKNKYTCNS